MRTALLGGACALALTLTGCGQGGTGEEAAETASRGVAPQDAQALIERDESPELGAFGIETADFDESVDPGDDFYQYVNGRWLDTFEIPAEFSNYGNFTKLFERSERRVRTIIEEAAASEAEAGTIRQKIGDLYASYLDQDAIDAAGLAPIQSQLDAYDAMETHEDVGLAFADVGAPARAPFGLYVDVDAKEPNAYAVYLTQSGLGMPNRDYYLKPEFGEVAGAYRAMLTKLLEAVGTEDAGARAQAIYDLEARLAEAHWTPAARRNRDLTYNPYSPDELASYAEGMPWAAVLDRLGLAAETKLVVREDDAIAKSAAIFAETPVETWADYLKAHALIAHADVLPREIDDIVFAFQGPALRGVEEQRPRWKRGVSAVNGTLGEAVGQVYVERHFPPESKAQMEELVGNLRAAFEQRLGRLDWMGEATKAEAREKLDGFVAKIAYPDAWTDYSGLEIVAGDPVGNRRRAAAFEYQEMIDKLGGPIDRTEWFMTPQTVNAYYSPNRNEIVFPAAILQAPFFDPEADPAVNYGGIGAVIGHEIGHGFDDQGRKSDGEGRLRDWWTDEDAERFDARAQALGAQYASYEPIEGMPLDPDLTMGENIGDLGGLTMAYEAYRLSLDGQEAPVLGGMTGDQRFFAAWAQVWKRLYREEELRNRIASDSHSPSEFRTNGVVRNMDAWYDAYAVTEDDDLYLPPEARVRIW